MVGPLEGDARVFRRVFTQKHRLFSVSGRHHLRSQPQLRGKHLEPAFDRLAQQVLSTGQGTWSRPTAMPMDAYRRGEEFVVEFDLPGVDPDAIELSVERNVLTVRAERRPVPRDESIEMQVSERTYGVYSRQLFLGDALDAEKIEAGYEAGVLTLRIPVAEKAKPRKIAVTGATSGQHAISV